MQPESNNTVRLRLMLTAAAYRVRRKPFANINDVLLKRKQKADSVYGWVSSDDISADQRAIQRLAFAGMLWLKMTYIYNASTWPAEVPASRQGESARNRNWINFNSKDVTSLCDGWECPWFAAWDAAFDNVVFAVTVWARRLTFSSSVRNALRTSTIRCLQAGLPVTSGHCYVAVTKRFAAKLAHCSEYSRLTRISFVALLKRGRIRKSFYQTLEFLSEQSPCQTSFPLDAGKGERKLWYFPAKSFGDENYSEATSA